MAEDRVADDRVADDAVADDAVTDDAVVAAPFTEFSCSVPEGAIDYNGHLNDSAYAKVLTDANEAFLDALGLSASYRERTGGSMYTVEITLRFLREVGADDVVRAESRVASHDSKRLRIDTTLLVGDATVATGSSLYLHVDTATGKVAPLPADRAARLAEVSVHEVPPV